MKISMRIWYPLYETDSEFKKLVSFLQPYQKDIDEIALQNEYYQIGYTPLEEFKKRCEIYKDRIQKLKGYGFKSVGITMLNTIGHSDDVWDWGFPQPPFQTMIDPFGKSSKTCYCPNTNEFKEYIREKYRLCAKAQPDFIWADDDNRIQHHPPLEFPCFCPKCISIFNQKYGTNFTRESLVKKLNSEEGRGYREKWVRQNIETMKNHFSLIEKAVHGVDADIELGWMHTATTMGTTWWWTNYDGFAFDEWMTALKGVKGRPGGAYYEDSAPIRFIRKVLECARQSAAYPDFVKDVQYEFDCFPHQGRLGKSVHMMILEGTTTIMNGCNGIAFCVLRQEEGSLDEYNDHMKAISEFRPLWKAIDEFAGNFKNAGFYPALSPQFWAKREVKNEDWLQLPTGHNDGSMAYAMNEIGIPFTMYEKGACGVILSGNMPQGYTKEELKGMLAKGVILDGRALECMWDAGLGEYCGASTKKFYTNGVSEQLTSDSLNGQYSNAKRYSRSGRDFYGLVDIPPFPPRLYDGYVLEPLNKSVRVLSELISPKAENLGPTFTLFENSLGGRVAIHGYSPWINIHSTAKRAQIVRTCDWISKGEMPVMIDKCIKVIPFIKVSDDKEQFLLMLLNASLDETGEFSAEIRMKSDKLYELRRKGKQVTIPNDKVKISKGKTVVEIENIMPWNFMVIRS